MNFEEVKNKIEEFSHGYYVVEGFLGEGAFSEVFLVKHVFLNHLRVLKLIKKPLSDLSGNDLSLQEARIVAQLNHENIIKIYDAGIIKVSNQNYLFFIMEYVPSGDLKQYLDSFINSNKFAPLYWVLNLIKQLSTGLSVLHSSNPFIVHGDLKPENILLSFNWKNEAIVKISDFGFSKGLFSLSNDQVMGTRPYMAPECFKNEFYTSSDIYSVGVIFYLFLTNKFPYDSKNYKSLDDLKEGKLWKQHLTKPSAYNSEVPEIIDEIVIRCLSFDYTKRFKDASELLDTVNECLDGLIDFGNEIYSLSENVKKAFRLAKYENKLQEAIDILDEYDMAMMFEKTIENKEFNAHKTEIFKNFSEILNSIN